MPRRDKGVPRPSMQGENHPTATLTWDAVRTIRRRYAEDRQGCRTLATEYGMSRVALRRVIRNETWVDPDYTPPKGKILENGGVPRPSVEGEVNSSVVLTLDQVRSMRQERATNNTLFRVLAEKYGVSASTVQLIIYNRRWTDPDYTPPPPKWRRPPREEN
jgi:hypothetical protein